MSKYETAARVLRQAYESGPVPPLRDYLSGDDGAGAYSIQTLNTRHWIAEGRRIVGRKIGLTSLAIQRQLGVNQPDYGILFGDMLVSEGETLSRKRLSQPRVEAEVAIVLDRDVDLPDANSADIMAAAAYATAALEIVDSRIADWKITFADTVADNGSSGAFVVAREPKSLVGLDLYACGMVLEIDGDVVSTGVGAACLGHPLHAAAWLARTLAQHGEKLRAGEVILTGALGPMVPLTSQAQIRATIGGLGSVGFRFGDGEK